MRAFVSNKIVTWEAKRWCGLNKVCAGSRARYPSIQSTPRPGHLAKKNAAQPLSLRISACPHLQSPIPRPNLLVPSGLCAPTQFGHTFGALRSRLHRNHLPPPHLTFLLLFVLPSSSTCGCHPALHSLNIYCRRSFSSSKNEHELHGPQRRRHYEARVRGPGGESGRVEEGCTG